MLFQINNKHLYLAIFTIVFAVNCKADELELHATSYHFNRSENFNEFNIGAGYNYQYGEKTYAVVGAFNNSYDKFAIYAGAKWLPIKIKHFKAGFIAGAVTGYEDDTDANEVQPIIIPEFQIHYKQLFLASRIIPDFGDNSSTTITLSIGFTLFNNFP